MTRNPTFPEMSEVPSYRAVADWAEETERGDRGELARIPEGRKIFPSSSFLIPFPVSEIDVQIVGPRRKVLIPILPGLPSKASIPLLMIFRSTCWNWFASVSMREAVGE